MRTLRLVYFGLRRDAQLILNAPRNLLMLLTLSGVILGNTRSPAAEVSDPTLDLLVRKGIITQEEAEKAKAEAAAMRTNMPAMTFPESKWKINNAIRNIELYGDLRTRFEYRKAEVPDNRHIELDRWRAAVRLGLRGETIDDFYYGVRLDTASNPRSPWVTFGTSSSGIPYQGPYGKSTFGVDISQVYLGWRPEKWIDLTVGKMPNPLYTTPMVWDTDLNPEGAAERFKYSIGSLDLFATFGQFIYADFNPSSASGGLGINGLTGQEHDTPFQFAWQIGGNYHFTTNVSAKMAATVYNYIGLQPNVSPFFGDPFVGEGAFAGTSSAFPVNGASGYGTSSSLLGNSSLGFPNNQVGLNHLLVLDVPAEVNFKIGSLNARVFGDFAYNIEGKQRAEDAAAGYAAFLKEQSAAGGVTVTPFDPQTKDVKAYQVGFGLSNAGEEYGPMQGLVYGSAAKKHTWEVRTYWQHIEQYALDPNLIDSDFFEGRGNLEGIYAAVAYALGNNFFATFRYGYASRINDKLGTGGANQDIPQVNPILHYTIFQADLTLRF